MVHHHLPGNGNPKPSRSSRESRWRDALHRSVNWVQIDHLIRPDEQRLTAMARQQQDGRTKPPDVIINSAISSARRPRGRPPLVGAGAEEASPRHRSRHELHGQGTGWPGPWHRWQAEVRVRRCDLGIQSADHAVH
jgi:hypothetical protein